MVNKEIVINDEKIPVSIIQSSKRKRTLSFRMTSSWLNIRTPITYNVSLLNRFFVKKEDWIYNTWLSQKTNKNTVKEYISWETFPYKWRNYRLKVIKWDCEWCNIEFNYSRFVVKIDKNISDNMRWSYIEFELNEWYKNKAIEIIIKEANKIIKAYNFDVKSVFVRSYKSKYGQCRKQDIYFNYQIIKLPLKIIRYIILHELCHIKHKNHSKEFWNLLKVLDKDCNENKKWIKDNWGFIFYM